MFAVCREEEKTATQQQMYFYSHVVAALESLECFDKHRYTSRSLVFSRKKKQRHPTENSLERHH